MNFCRADISKADEAYYPYLGTKIQYNYGFLNLYNSYGTIGFCAYDNTTGKYGVVTNAHVADNWDKTYKNQSKKDIGVLSKRSLGGTIDAAFVEITNSNMRVTEEIKASDNIYISIGDLAMESAIIQGAPVRRFGVTTGDTQGTISYVNYSVSVEYDEGTKTLTQCVAYTNAGQSGDSGGPVILRTGNLDFVGIHFASRTDGTLGFACRATNILSELNLSIVNTQWMLNHPELWVD